MSQQPYETRDVTAWPVVEVEPAGDSGAVWLGDEDGRSWLFKPRKQYASHTGGDDWAERITTEVAHVLGVPAAEAHLAVRGGVRGSISRDVCGRDRDLQTGAVLLAAHNPAFERKSPDRAGHRVDAIRAALADVAAPDGHEALGSGFDVFCGYLLLDALVANVDRHEENWAVLRAVDATHPDRLSPSWDHGSALGHNLTQDYCRRTAVEDWAVRGRAGRFERATDGRLTLVGLAVRALGMCDSGAASSWWSALEAVSEQTLLSTVERADLSQVHRTFVGQLLVINRRRLLDEHDRGR